jgi:hypothetical protein
MTIESVLTLDVDAVNVVGSSHEADFGNPRDIAEDLRVSQWVHGLREGGGGG